VVDWSKAEKHLESCEKEYTEAGSQGYLVLNYVIDPLRDRLESGERTKELWREIMETPA
jgi:hypothetical protein